MCLFIFLRSVALLFLGFAVGHCSILSNRSLDNREPAQSKRPHPYQNDNSWHHKSVEQSLAREIFIWYVMEHWWNYSVSSFRP